MLQIEYSVPRRLTLFIAMDPDHVYSEFIAFDFYSAIDVRPFELGHKNVRRTKTTSIHWIQLTSDNVKRVYINRRGAMARHIPLLFLSRFFFISFDSCFFTKIRCCFSTHIKCVLFSKHWKHFYVFDYWSKYA